MYVYKRVFVILVHTCGGGVYVILVRTCGGRVYVVLVRTEGCMSSWCVHVGEG